MNERSSSIAAAVTLLAALTASAIACGTRTASDAASSPKPAAHGVGAPPDSMATTGQPGAATANRLGTAREIRAYFRRSDTAETMRVWIGPGQSRPQVSQMTDLLATIGGGTVYTLSTGVIRLAGICRSTSKGLDQLILSLSPHPQAPGGARVIWYDEKKHEFTNGDLGEDIGWDLEEHLGCASGQTPLPASGPAVPCACPWEDAPSNNVVDAAASGRTKPLAAAIAGGPGRSGSEITVHEEVGDQPKNLPEPERASAKIPIEVEEYVDVLAGVRAGKASFESLLEAGDRAKKALVPSRMSTPLEEMSVGDYAAVEKKMEGYHVGREEILVVDPDAKALLALAKAHGDAADVAYFETLNETTDGILPKYLSMVTDYSACTMYGDLQLVAAYRAWSGYATRFPGRYASRVAEHLESAKETLREDTCACGEKDTVIKEMGAFLSEFPSEPISSDVRKRLDSVKAGTSKFRFNCTPS